jgi:PPOX class probable F420-dependent enzyme
LAPRNTNGTEIAYESQTQCSDVRPPARFWRVILDESECWNRVERAEHGVLSTVHPERGVDPVPVVFAVVNRVILVPVDTVKPKRSLNLARVANVARDPRCALLVEHYSADWSELWWVRVHALASVSASSSEPDPGWVHALADRYPQYRLPGAVTAVMVLRPTAVRGWAAGPGEDDAAADGPAGSPDDGRANGDQESP